MNVLSLFDGMSCGQIALERAGITVGNYYASEIDKYAMKVSKANYPNTYYLGNVLDHNNWKLQEVDLLIGGSPCQGFSYAGKLLNFNDHRSALFFEFVKVLKKISPKYFLLENVKMGKKFQDVISDHLGVEPIEINSALVSAQNRKRLYWTNIKGIEQPKDKGILFKDIIESNVDECFLSIPHKDFKGENQLNPNYKSQANTIHNSNKKAPTVCAGTHGYALGHIKQPVLIMKARGNNPGGLRAENGKTPTLTSNSWEHNFHLTSKELADKIFTKEFRYRKITPIECERLQTVPDNYTNHVSNTQRYKMLGNGWTIDVIAHILKGLK